MLKKIKIAVDGPSGAGKSSLAKAIARELGLIYVDTGALYRGVGLFVKRSGKNPKDADEIKPLLNDLDICIKYIDGAQRIILNGEDVSELIRTPEISMYASNVSAHPIVRELLLSIQKKMAEAGGVIMDGRDIGTVIMPDADVKIFLTASNEARARRRYKELTGKGQECCYEDVLAEMIERDKNDSERETAPLTAADDAVYLDNSDLTFEETIAEAVNIIRQKAGE